MGYISILKRGGEDYHDYKDALKHAKKSIMSAKKAIEEICELTEDMEDEYGYSERDEERHRGEYDEMRERRSRR